MHDHHPRFADAANFKAWTKLHNAEWVDCTVLLVDRAPRGAKIVGRSVEVRLDLEGIETAGSAFAIQIDEFTSFSLLAGFYATILSTGIPLGWRSD